MLKYFLTFALLFQITWAAKIKAVQNVVYVNDRVVFNIKSKKDGLNSLQRARAIAASLSKANLKSIVSKSSSKGNINIALGTNIIVRVTPKEARAHQMSINELSNLWTNNLKRALNASSLILSKKKINIAPGITETLNIKTASKQPINILNSDLNVLEANLEGDVLRLKALTEGHATVAVSDGSDTDTIVVDVNPFAAKIPENIEASVFVKPCDVQTVNETIIGAITSNLETRDNPKIQFAKLNLTPVHPEQSKNFGVPVTVEAPNSTRAHKIVNVSVKNVDFSLPKPTQLWYCNHPENLKGPGFIDAVQLLPNVPTIVLYHHINTSSSNLAVQVAFRNTTNSPARVAIISGDGKPGYDPVRIGLGAGVSFLHQWKSRAGEIISIPSMSTVPITIHKLTRKETMSGLCYVMLMPGGADNIGVVTEAMAPSILDSRWSRAVSSSKAWHVASSRPLTSYERHPYPLSKYVYAEPYIDINSEYKVGGTFGFIPIGAKPISSLENNGKLEGNFGAIYDIKADILNPTNKDVPVEVVFEMGAGYGAGLFVVDGNMIKTGPMKPKQVFKLKNIDLAPGAHSRIRITTIPLSGSNYPALITIRPAGIAR